MSDNKRRTFIGGSDARIIMGQDEADLVRLWREKRGELAPKDLSEDLIVQLGRATEDLNRHLYERCTTQTITDCQKHIRHPIHQWMAATLDAWSSRPGPCSRPSSCCPGPLGGGQAATRARKGELGSLDLRRRFTSLIPRVAPSGCPRPQRGSSVRAHGAAGVRRR